MNLNTPSEMAQAGIMPPPPRVPAPLREPAGDPPPAPEPPKTRAAPEAAPVRPLGPAARDELLRSIPKVDLLAAEAVLDSDRLAGLSPESLLAAVRGALGRRRRSILSGHPDPAWDPVAAVELEAERLEAPTLKPVINATGVVLHTNLGRSPLSFEAAENVMRVALSYSTLEYDPQTGRRTDRQRHVESLAAELFGGEAALAVNNNAAALLLISAALASGREIVISRGELVEIGASFRIGDILAAGGAVLREVGATNRVVAADYDRALAGGRAALLLEVHASNFRLSGYCGRPEPAELAEAAKRHGVPWVCDLGSGALADLSAWLPDEPSARRRLAEGADLVTMSGDKLLGAAQAGLIVGRAGLIEPLRRHPLARALRIDKLSLAAMEATLRLARRPREALKSVPALAMITASPEELDRKAGLLLGLIGPLEGFLLETAAAEGQAGGGAAPDQGLPSRAVAVSPNGGSTAALDQALRSGAFPVVARIWRGRLWLDVRTIAEDELEGAALAVREAAASLAGSQSGPGPA
jgi:L-seryl-tRNA(Ser) seleniumtransferase